MPTLDEAARAVGVCEFCNALGDLLCDGKYPDGHTCDKKICRSHARTVAFLRLSGKGGRKHDTRDLCPDCIAAKREAF